MFDFALTVAAGVTQQVPTRQIAVLAPGIVQKVEVGFPDGCVGQVHLVVRYRGRQLWPSNPEGNFAANDHVIVFQPMFTLDAPVEVELRGWNAGAFSHIVTFRFDVLPFSVAQVGQAQKKLEVEVVTWLRGLGVR